MLGSARKLDSVEKELNNYISLLSTTVKEKDLGLTISSDMKSQKRAVWNCSIERQPNSWIN